MYKKRLNPLQSGLNHVYILLFCFWKKGINVINLLVNIENSNPEKALTICNFYFNSRIFQSNSEFKPKDALKATSILYHYISILFNQLDSVPLLSGIPKFSTEHFSQSSPSQQSILKDLRKWLPVYEKYATQAYPFPEGENLSKIGYERHQRVLKVFEWWVQLELFPCWSAQLGEGKAINEYIDRHYSVLEVNCLVEIVMRL